MFELWKSDLTTDGLLNGKIVLAQPRKGYRAGSDAVLLAAAVPAIGGDEVLDVGAGVGAASLCLAWRCQTSKVTAFDSSRSFIKLAAHNASINNLSRSIQTINGDVKSPPAAIKDQLFSHVMTNPPFYPVGHVTPSSVSKKANSHIESVPLVLWVDFCIKRCKPKGTVTILQRADRLALLLSALISRVGDITIFPLWSAQNKPAKRIIVQARVGSNGPTNLMPGIVMHHSRGEETRRANLVLREGAPLNLRPK